jgi:hypothetical protein
MDTHKVSCSDLSLWPIVDRIRWFVQDEAFCKAGFMANPSGALLLSSVEGVYLTDGMLTTFVKNDPPEGDFARSLWFWGAIQALVVQQDAIIHLGEALGKHPKSVRELTERASAIGTIRDLRNRTAEHPMIDDKTQKKFTFPAVHEGKCYSVLLLDENSDPPSFQKCDMDMCDLIAKQ